MLFKNVASQKIHIYAYDSTTGAAKTGDAANITAYVSLDGTANAIDDTNPTEVDATNMPGIYCFDLTQAETNCNAFALYAKSSTANIRIEPIIGFTTGAAATQTGDSYAIVDALTTELAKVPKSDSNVTWNATALASINAEVLDVIATDTIAEMSQGAPPASPTIKEVLNYLYRKFRNRNTTTTTENSVYDDAGTTVLFKETHSDNGVTFDKGKFTTGA